MSEDSKALINGGVRTLAQFVPLVGGAVAQAWSEYEAHKQNQRATEFFNQLGNDLKLLQERSGDLSSQVESMSDVAECLELSVACAKKETNDTKRRMFSTLYSHYLGYPLVTSPDERIDLIHHLEQLSLHDVELLRRFEGSNGVMRGDMVTGTTASGWLSMGQQSAMEQGGPQDWLLQHGDVVHSIAKLETRGLLYPTTYNAVISFAGDSGSPLNLFRQKAWRMTPTALKLLNALR